METGLVHIYTGTGKGKTTASVGLGVRALSHGLKVCYSYYNKKPELYGSTEVTTLETLGAKIFGLSLQHPSFNSSVTKDEMRDKSYESIDKTKELIKSEHFDMLIMDEILISVRDGSIDEDYLLDFIKNRPKNLELVLTGRDATEKLIEAADYVSEINKIKHPMDSGVMSREGIEY